MSLGDTIPTDEEDFSSYTVAAFYRGPSTNTVDPNYVEEFTVDPPVCGRFFVVQRTAPQYDRQTSVISRNRRVRGLHFDDLN